MLPRSPGSTATMDGKKPARSRPVQIFRAIGAAVAYILLSGGLIAFNKILMRSNRFPHPMALATCHMFVNSLLAMILYPIFPSLYWSMEQTRGKRLALYKWFIPIGVLKAVMVHCSNQALTLSSLAFLRYIEQSNLAMVFFLSAVIGLQEVNRQRLVVILWVILFTCLCISGEFKFSTAALGIILIANIAESTRAVMEEVVLKRTLDLDPFTYVNFVAPVSFVVLAICTWVRWTPAVLTDFCGCWYLIIPNSILAFALNVSIAALIRETSAVGLLLASVTKDVILVVCISDFVFHDPVSIRQWICFPLTLCGVLFWSVMRVYPKSAVVQNFETLLGVPKRKSLNERTALMGQDESPSQDPSKRALSQSSLASSSTAPGGASAASV